MHRATCFELVFAQQFQAAFWHFKYVEEYGDKLVFAGGLDARILESGDRRTIRKGVVDFIEGMKKRGARFIYASNHSISTNVDYDDFLYSLQVNFRTFSNALIRWS